MSEPPTEERPEKHELTANEMQLLAKFMQFLSKRDEDLLSQLTNLNKNLSSQNSQMCDMFLRVMRKQQCVLTDLKLQGKKQDDESCDKHVSSITQLDHHTKDEKTQTRTLETKHSSTSLVKHSSRRELQQQQKSVEENFRVQMTSPIAVVQFNERELLIDIGPKAREVEGSSHQFNLKLATLAISRWIADLYDTLSRQTFKGFYSRHMSQAEAKVFFTHNMALNFEHMTRWFWKEQPELWKEHKQRLLLHFETETAKTLDFMMVKYPQKKKTFISQEYREAIPVMDRSTDTQFDMVVKTGCFFKYDPKRQDYARQIKIFLNKLILESRGHYKNFRKIMKEVFRISNGEVKNQIGMKLRESTPLFTKEEIAREGFDIKMPEILRIVVKWIEELQRRIQRIADGSILYGTFSRKDNSLQPEYLTKELIKTLSELTNREQMVKLSCAAEQLKVRIRSLLSLLPQYLDKHEPYFQHIKSNEVRSGLLSYILSETVENLSVNYLTFLIHFLEHISFELFKKEPKPMGDVPAKKKLEFSFVSFNVADLLRSRCSGTLDEIKEVYDNLSNHPNLTIYRIKNRLDTSNRDFLINLRLNNTPMLCEVQLAITDNAVDQRDVYLNQFCHFIYELSRAKYGPIGEAVMINTHLTEFAPFFERNLSRIHDASNQPPKDLTVEHWSEGELEVRNFIGRDNHFTFLCSNCLCFKKAHDNYYAHFDNCSSFLACEPMKSGNNFDKQRILCVDCVIITLDDKEKETYLIGPIMQEFFQMADFEQFRKEAMHLLNQDKLPREGYVCLVQRTAPRRTVEVMQMEKINNQLRFIPVFYETSPKKQMLSLNDLQYYYVFQWRAGFNVKHKTAQELKHILSDRLYIELEQEDILEVIRMISYAFLPTLNEMSPTARKDSEREQLRDTSLQCLESTIPERTVVFASPLITMESLKNMNKELLAVGTYPRGDRIIILSTVYDVDELKRLNTIGRALTQGELTMMLNATTWNMNERDVGDNSFEVFTQELRNVRVISLQKNKVTRVDFINSPSLVELNLASNGIKRMRLQSTTFPNLARLTLSNNRIVEVEAVNHRNLKHLIMRQCGIQAVDFSKWDLPQLEQLDLGVNSLVELDLSDQDLSKLVKLNIEDNNLEYLTLPLNLECLEELILKNNSLRTMDLKLHILSSIVTLEFRQNLIEAVTLPNELNTLYELYIFNNKLRSIDLSKLRLHKLGNLHLEENRLERIDLPWDLPELKWLNLADNKLKGVDLSRIKLPKLKFLNLERNRIQSLLMPMQLKLLEELHLHTNRLSVLDLSGNQLWHLKLVDASSNLLEKVILGNHLPSLESVNISNLWYDLDRNCLTTLNLKFSEFKSLSLLSFEYNFIEEVLFDEIVPVAPRLKHIKAAYNPFDKIPCNICVQHHCKHFPALETLVCGISQLEMFGVWVLTAFSDEEKNELFKITAERIGRPLDVAGIRLCLRIKSKIEERLKYTKEDIIAVVQTIYEQEKIPQVFEKMVAVQLQLLKQKE